MTDRAVIKNASWIIGCKIIQSLLALVVGMQTARYLGPSGYGLLSYAASVTAFFIPIMQLGFRGTLVRELIEGPERTGTTLGTALGLNLLSGLACVAGIWAFVALTEPGEPETVLVCTLYAGSLLTQALELIQYWFQAKLLSRYTAVISVAAYAAAALYKLWLLASGAQVLWFALAQTLESGVLGLCLLAAYHKQGGQRLTFSLARGGQMFHISKYYILSGLMTAVFAKTDSVMLKLMLGPAETGYYSAAFTCATVTSFVFGAIIDSMRPGALENRKNAPDLFRRDMLRLVSVTVWLALGQSLMLTLGAKPLVTVLYGDAYAPAAPVLGTLTWFSAFSYLGAVRDVWILAEGKQSCLWVVNLVGALGNVALNALLIPALGAVGAAAASVLTQLFTNVVLGFLMAPLRPYNRLLVRGLDPRYLLDWLGNLAKREEKP